MTNVMCDREALLRTVSTFPLINNHCHNLLTSDASLTCPLEICFSEAHADALKDASQTSAFKRGGLMDVQSHVGLVDVARRIVRIENIAENILYDLATSVACTDQKVLNFAAFEEPLKKQLETCAKSESVVGFKSIAAYRSGLNINCVQSAETAAIALGNFISDFESLPDKKGSVRLAGYLASVYSNVYVDIGLVFPNISASGQQASLRELLEICPSNKLLFSTDGHYHPESFYVAAIQGREALSFIGIRRKW
ncbi:glutamine synthetase/guanido kinase [Gigaspora margarita]|uniref:Glutamine synthetase/guanido kinase n=1 Tax=Gigaspora margarita TaxID=4874 RepID=A0A8H4EK64_GIGMA|nr:glutamine synthetase/guanido kinase [Gigaspora margarita]